MVTSGVVVCNWVWFTNEPFGLLTSHNSVRARDGWPIVQVVVVVVVGEVSLTNLFVVGKREGHGTNIVFLFNVYNAMLL